MTLDSIRNSCDVFGTPCSNVELMELIFAHPRVDINCRHGSCGKTILHGAAWFNNVDAVKLILAEPRFTSANALDCLKHTAVVVAASEGNWNVFKELVLHPSIDLGGKDKNGASLEDLIR